MNRRSATSLRPPAFALAAVLASVPGPAPAAWAGPAPGAPETGETGAPTLVVVAGVGGDPERRARFRGWAQDLCLAAAGFPWPVVTRLLVERPGDLSEATSTPHSPGASGGAGGCVPAGRSTRDELAALLGETAAALPAGDPLLLVLIGHGSGGGGSGGEARFNLPGPDLTPADLARMLEDFDGHPVTVAHLGSAAGGFLPALSAPGRILLAASRAHETNETRFARHFIAAFEGSAAGGGAAGDRNRDGRLSALEVFDYARAAAEREYAEEGLLRTEHPLLDDDGDGEGAAEPAAVPGSDGVFAARTALLFPASGLAGTDDGASETERRLAAERDALAARVDALRAAREGMGEDEYFAELERLLLELAGINERLRALREGPP